MHEKGRETALFHARAALSKITSTCVGHHTIVTPRVE
jgi:hypothetical protein